MPRPRDSAGRRRRAPAIRSACRPPAAATATPAAAAVARVFQHQLMIDALSQDSGPASGGSGSQAAPKRTRMRRSCRSDAIVCRCTSLPSCSMPTRSQTCSTSVSTCEEKSTACPCSRAVRIWLSSSSRMVGIERVGRLIEDEERRLRQPAPAATPPCASCRRKGRRADGAGRCRSGPRGHRRRWQVFCRAAARESGSARRPVMFS